MVNARKFVLFLLDVGLTLFSGVIALFARFGFDFQEMSRYNESILVYTLIASVIYILNRNYSVVWEYANARDFLLLIRGSVASYIANLVFFYFYRSIILPRSVGFATFLGSMVLIVLSRITWQWLILNRRKKKTGEKRILIIGAGDAGVSILEEFEKHPHLGKVIAFVDDSPRKIGRRVRGIPVFGPVDRIMDLVEQFVIDEVIVAIPSATKQQMERILEKIDLKRVKVKTLPSIRELMEEKVKLSHLKEISIEDLLGREEVKVNIREIENFLKGKRVLVTGAGGSIGFELCKQIAKIDPEEIILLGHGENSIYLIDEFLNENFPNLKRKRIIADVAERKILEYWLSKLTPEIVFHAAAHKHVHLMEENPLEAFRVNTLGTINLIELSKKTGVKHFVFISTDKAVNPSSVMGLTKRISELYILSQNNTRTRFSIVRFGNVLGSRGSVVEKFKRQIEKGGPVTVTDPRMKRYFMSIPEAVSLILQSLLYSSGKDLFILDMGEQIPIVKLAETMIMLSGFIPHQDVKIVFTGSRPGEKIYEELTYPYEKKEPTPHPKIFKVLSEKDFSEKEVRASIERMKNAYERMDMERLFEEMKKLVPEARINAGIFG
ncbi:nucleoside-diphosphate sugar epimerase/dehydratase [Thermotoga sp. KOL6]|uniref:nucleoside-diphosphate sugar epimerase/dehydratase n=1 Tax=Thermotoga sp. KOL6 TaxID=126741 RepID=UPI000C76F9BC|nr:nucleoside-diphosphate sugar epimerase/dehydratase [Thermotoga sp. KOL6]PLV60349.1 lipopolysaccharide biosynthesis protein [Thermotoga sp. KOL6]